MAKTTLSRWKRDRGAVLVEAAIAIPLLLLVILGSLEFGIAWDAKSGTTSGLRSGLLRVATQAQHVEETDIRVLQSILGEVDPDNAERLQWVVIFNADPANGDIPTIVETCRATLAGGGNEDFCVAYDTETLVEIAETADSAAYQTANFNDGSIPCVDTLASGAAALDAGGFCAANRTVDGDIEIGVAFEYQHNWLTGILPFDAPTFREVQTSSTFFADGTQVSGSSGGGPGSVFAFGGPDSTFDTLPPGLVDSFTTVGNGVSAGTPAEIVTAPNGENILGLFGPGESLNFSTPVGEAYDQVCISFDLHIIGTWEGKSPPEGSQDKFSFDIGNDGDVEFVDGFDDDNDPQVSANGLIATATDELKFDDLNDTEIVDQYASQNVSKWANENPDVTFRIDSQCYDQTGAAGGDLAILFTSTLDQSNGELWAIDNLEIWTTN